MSSLADAPDLVGFFSYSREDDEGSGGKLSNLRERIQEELRGQLGRTKKDFKLWQDKRAIAHGELWDDGIRTAIAESVFFIPIVTPTAVRSYHCKFEFDSFLAREKALGRSNLVFPILYISVPALTEDRWRQDPLLSIIGSRQYEDWRTLRHLDAFSTEVALRVERFCANICRALQQEWLSPEERRQAEARRVAEAERSRQQEIEIRRLADEEERRRMAELEDRRREQEQRRVVKQAKWTATKEPLQTQSKQEPDKPVTRWPHANTGWAALMVAAMLVGGVWSLWSASENQRVALERGLANTQQSESTNPSWPTVAQQPVSTPTTAFTIRPDTEVVGPSPLAPAVAFRRVGECKDSCARLGTCNAFTYHKSSGSCYLYAEAYFVPNADFDSGARK